MKPLLSYSSSQFFKITLLKKDRIISDDHELWKTFDTFFKNAVDSLVANSTSPYEHVDICILKYRDHQSTKLIQKNASFVNPFNFSEITEKDWKRTFEIES